MGENHISFDFLGIIELAVDAGPAMLEVYKQDFDAFGKLGQSSQTQANITSYNCIVGGGGRLTPSIPIFPVEATDKEKDQRAGWQRYWLIDPLDGTKEFIERNGEFTVNIALIDPGRAVLGMVHPPTLGVTYWGEQDKGAFKQPDGQAAHGICVSLPPGGSPYEPKAHSGQADVVWHHTSVTKAMRARHKAQKPFCIWFTGLSGSGKSTLANALDKALHLKGFHTCLLDGDNVRQGLCKDLDMSDVGRSENIRRVAEVAKLMTDAGLIVITVFISPFRHDRDAARALFGEGEFIEIFVDTPLETCKARDPKGLYAKAQRGEIKNFTGVSSLYEQPLAAEFCVETVHCTIEEIVESIVRGIVK